MSRFLRRSTVVAVSTLVAAVVSTCRHGSNAFNVVVAFAPVAENVYNIGFTEGKVRESPLFFAVAATSETTTAITTKSPSTKGPKDKVRTQKNGSKAIRNPKPSSKVTIRTNRLSSKPTNTNKTFKPLKDLKLGSTVSGTVVDVCEFGAFVNIGYATRGSRAGTALLHISQIRDDRIDHVKDVLKVGDDIEGARVISVDLAKGEVGLSLRKQRPKRRDFSTIKVGDKLEGKVASVMPYGVFADVGANVNALLHISRITGGAIENIRHHLNEGDPVSVHVIDVDLEKKTMAVSMLDKKADQYLDRRMSQKMKKYYGTAVRVLGKGEGEGSSTELDYFDQVINELEYALRARSM